MIVVQLFDSTKIRCTQRTISVQGVMSAADAIRPKTRMSVDEEYRRDKLSVLTMCCGV